MTDIGLHDTKQISKWSVLNSKLSLGRILQNAKYRITDLCFVDAETAHATVIQQSSPGILEL